MTEESPAKRGFLKKLILLLILVSCGYLSVKYGLEKVRQAEVAKQEVAKYDNVETEIFDLASDEEKSSAGEEIKEITIGQGDHFPTDKRNMLPIELELCVDSRRDQCPYYIKININTETLSFYQGFCGWKFKKGV